MPGEDFPDSTRIILGELTDLPHLAELPARGVPATMVGRTLAVITDLGADLQPAGWRLTDAAGIDQRRAASQLARDLDTVEELTQGYAGPFKAQLTGPWTLAATVERPRGDRVLADHGARRDLAQALAEGVRAHVADLRRRVAGARVVVQIDEPLLPAVLAAAIPTASGFHRHRAVSPADAAQTLDWVFDAVSASGAEPVLHCCAGDVPWALLTQTSARAVSFDLSRVAPADYDAVAGWVDEGRQAWLGLVPATDPADTVPTAPELTKRLLSWWSALGYSDVEQLPEMVVTPTCGLAGASPQWSRRALELATTVARNVSVEQGTMDP